MTTKVWLMFSLCQILLFQSNFRYVTKFLIFGFGNVFSEIEASGRLDVEAANGGVVDEELLREVLIWALLCFLLCENILEFSPYWRRVVAQLESDNALYSVSLSCPPCLYCYRYCHG
jgi:hypothetical protein